MANRYTAFGWSIDLVPSWTAKIRQEVACGETSAFVAIAPKTNDALLRLTPDERGIVSAAEWVEVVGQFNRAKGRRVSATRCGDFAGYAMEFGTTGEWLRGWALCANSIPLDVTYRCRLADAGRDDPVVDSMLNTLRLERSSGA
jgi:hypothetical protein